MIMRIAQVAPLAESVPPLLYGGSERVVSYLTEQLVALGHEVTLYASGDSQTRARLVAGCPRALWRDPNIRETLPHHIRLLELVFRDAADFDVIHFHCDYVHFPLVRRHHCPTVTTMHGWMHPPDLQPLLDEYRDVPLVSVSDDQRSPIPHANWLATVYHGLPRELLSFHAKPAGYLAFLGLVTILSVCEINTFAGQSAKSVCYDFVAMFDLFRLWLGAVLRGFRTHRSLMLENLAQI